MRTTSFSTHRCSGCRGTGGAGGGVLNECAALRRGARTGPGRGGCGCAGVPVPCNRVCILPTEELKEYFSQFGSVQRCQLPFVSSLRLPGRSSCRSIKRGRAAGSCLPGPGRSVPLQGPAPSELLLGSLFCTRVRFWVLPTLKSFSPWRAVGLSEAWWFTLALERLLKARAPHLVNVAISE